MPDPNSSMDIGSGIAEGPPPPVDSLYVKLSYTNPAEDGSPGTEIPPVEAILSLSILSKSTPIHDGAS